MSEFNLQELLDGVKRRDPGQKLFYQAVEECYTSLSGFVEENPKYASMALLERLVEPERVIMFRVPWQDDQGKCHINRGFRVQMSTAIGPYKGGLRFHPSVNLDMLKFLAFEQVLKNSLTTLPMGGGKGGSDFDPKGKSDLEVMRFCQSFMTELSRHIGQFTDVPAGDIGVGGREIGYLFGQYKRITNEYSSVLTGKDMSFSGSLIRPEATGYGLIYFATDMLSQKGQSFEGKKVLLSGSGNVSLYAAEKLLERGAKVLTVSDSNGFLLFKEGLNGEELKELMDLKWVRRGRLRDFKCSGSAEYFEGKKPWSVPADCALPCAHENEINGEEAKTLLDNGVKLVAEGANMPSTNEAIAVYQKAKIMYAPGKASNAGGVATSGLEMSQNAMRYGWTREEVDRKLREIMDNIHGNCVKYGKTGDYVDYVKGANVAGFIKVADAMLAEGLV